MQAFCSQCGNALSPSARFCSACGTVVAGMPTGYPPAGFDPQPRLMRPIFGRQFAGVCAAMANTYSWDVGLVRILAVVGGIFLFPIVELVYIAGWIGIPEEIAPLPQAMTPPTQT